MAAVLLFALGAFAFRAVTNPTVDTSPLSPRCSPSPCVVAGRGFDLYIKVLPDEVRYLGLLRLQARFINDADQGPTSVNGNRHRADLLETSL